VTPDPDVTPVGFGATEGPGALVQRRRNPLWLLLSILLAMAALVGVGWFVKEQADNAPGRDEAVAEGRVAALDGEDTPLVRFRGDGDYTVWLELDDVTLSNNRETIVAATNCVAAFSNGGSARFRGARQGSNVTIGDRSTVGTFKAPKGAVQLSCRQLPFGRRGRRGTLREERAFFVAPGKPGVGWQLWVGMFAGIALLIPAGLALGRFKSGSLRPR
jgi:hypothetical protein